tara:strand:+ start:888 stop:1580 length:693 start_codon:yes stop_codon:yes gene_type:complete
MRPSAPSLNATNAAPKSNPRRLWGLVLLLVTTLLNSACGSRNIELTNSFPVPLIQPVPAAIGVHLPPELLNFTHAESLGNDSVAISVGGVQQRLFQRLSGAAFADMVMLEGLQPMPDLDGILEPEIKDFQLSTPAQTRSDYYEVWIRFQLHLYDSEANLVGSIDLPAYGKANKNNFGNISNGLYAATVAACRDAMAYFSLNFRREPLFKQWLAKPPNTSPVNGVQPGDPS